MSDDRLTFEWEEKLPSSFPKMLADFFVSLPAYVGPAFSGKVLNEGFNQAVFRKRMEKVLQEQGIPRYPKLAQAFLKNAVVVEVRTYRGFDASDGDNLARETMTVVGFGNSAAAGLRSRFYASENPGQVAEDLNPKRQLKRDFDGKTYYRAATAYITISLSDLTDVQLVLQNDATSYFEEAVEAVRVMRQTGAVEVDFGTEWSSKIHTNYSKIALGLDEIKDETQKNMMQRFHNQNAKSLSRITSLESNVLRASKARERQKLLDFAVGAAVLTGDAVNYVEKNAADKAANDAAKLRDKNLTNALSELGKEVDTLNEEIGKQREAIEKLGNALDSAAAGMMGNMDIRDHELNGFGDLVRQEEAYVGEETPPQLPAYINIEINIGR